MTVGGGEGEQEDYMLHYAEIFISQQLTAVLYQPDPMIRGVNPMEE